MIPDGGTPVFNPYTVAHRQGFIDAMAALDYELVDSWTKPKILDVPFHPECRLEAYTGLYFRLRGGDTTAAASGPARTPCA
jgi:hypothetical protein